MPVRIPRNSIVVIRNGNHVIPPLGQLFEFTDAELADINAVNPDAVRLPVNESATYEAASQQLAQPDYAAAADPLAAVAAKLVADRAAADAAAKLVADRAAADAAAKLVADRAAADAASAASTTTGGKKAAADAGGDL